MYWFILVLILQIIALWLAIGNRRSRKNHDRTFMESVTSSPESDLPPRIARARRLNKLLALRKQRHLEQQHEKAN